MLLTQSFISRRVFLGVALVILLVLPSGCGSGGDAQETAPAAGAGLAAVDLLARASAQLMNTPTVRFSLTVEGTTYVDAGHNIRLLDANGELQRPDRVKATFKVKVLAPTLTINLITIGSQSWTTDLITGKWGPAPSEFSYDPQILFDNQNGIGPVMGRVHAPKLVDDERLGEHDAHHVTASVDQAVIGPLTAQTMTGSPVTVDLWIDAETDDLLRARLAEPASDQKDPAIWTLDLFDHGKQVEIEPPV